MATVTPHAVAGNYRRAYTEAFKADPKLTDAEIIACWRDCPVAPTSEMQDDWVLIDMENLISQQELASCL